MDDSCSYVFLQVPNLVLVFFLAIWDEARFSRQGALAPSGGGGRKASVSFLPQGSISLSNLSSSKVEL